MQAPPSRLVLVYVGTAHLSLLGAAALAVFVADEIATSFLFPRVLACVHLVTLGWLTATAVGAVYALLPRILRAPLRVGWHDALAAILILSGSSGVVAHMFLGSYSGLAWSGGTIAAGAALVALRAGHALRRAPAPPLQRLTIPLALWVLTAAAALGALVALDRERVVFAAGHLRAMAAHAHLALVGWLLLLTVGVGHRLLPMLLPAHPVRGRRPSWTVALLVSGTVALPTAWLLAPVDSAWPALAALPIGWALVLFALDLMAMRRQRLPKAVGLPRRDPGLLLVAWAVGCLLGAVVLAAWILATPFAPGLVSLYGVVLLLGGFSSLVLGVGFRLWPIFAWMRAFARDATVPANPAPALPSLALQWSALLAWIPATALLGAGVARMDPALTRAGAVAWTVAAAAAAANLGVVLVRARRRGA